MCVLFSALFDLFKNGYFALLYYVVCLLALLFFRNLLHFVIFLSVHICICLICRSYLHFYSVYLFVCIYLIQSTKVCRTKTDKTKAHMHKQPAENLHGYKSSQEKHITKKHTALNTICSCLNGNLALDTVLYKLNCHFKMFDFVCFVITVTD